MTLVQCSGAPAAHLHTSVSGRRFPRWALTALAAAWLIAGAAGCGDEGDGDPEAGTDGGRDVSLVDAASDRGTMDTRAFDAAADLTQDTLATDAAADMTTDGTADAAPDTAPDMAPDSASDTAPDMSAADATPDQGTATPPVLAASHTGWARTVCSDCHSLLPVQPDHSVASFPIDCAGCHGGNGACDPNGGNKIDHVSNNPCTACHKASNGAGTNLPSGAGKDHSGFTDSRDKCVACHFAAQGTVDCSP